VNIPAGSSDALKGLRVTRQSPLFGTERFVEHTSPSNRRYFWSVYEDSRSDVEGTDVWATSQGYVAVTPLRVGEFDPKGFDRWTATSWALRKP
jgi:5'-nucleotidase